jgi:hypothetical protein
VSDTFEFIDAEYADLQSKNDTVPTPSITKMCAWLLVSRSAITNGVIVLIRPRRAGARS